MIRYMPNLDSMLWAHKSLEYFDSVEELMAFVADQRTRFCRFIGKDRSFLPEDVQFRSDTDLLMKWKNFRNVILDGQVIGFCGE